MKATSTWNPIPSLCGGDLNRLDLAKLADISGLEILVDFPTRGNSKLDNCLTNKPELFAKPFPITTLIKTHHRGFILPAGTLTLRSIEDDIPSTE